MSNLEIKDFNFTDQENRKRRLLRDFKQVAHDLKKTSVLREKIASSLKGWLSLKMTKFMQDIGYNGRKIRDFREKRIILNIGCLEVTNDNYVNCDLFPDIDQIFQIMMGKSKIEHDLFIDLSSYDKNLSGAADAIILSHVLEHLPSIVAITAFKNCFAYLKQGGYIRVSVPYLGTYDQPNIPQCQHFENRMLAKNKLIYDYGHQFMYDAELLALIMEEAGFSEVKEVAFAKGILGETDLPHCQPESIYLTAVKA